MEEFLGRAWEQLVGRMGGPFHLRFILQPLMASLIAIRAGLKDARGDRPAYLRAILTDPAQRRTLIREGCKDVFKVFAVAFMIDCIYQIVVLQWYYPVQALIVAFALAVIPYILLRGPTARLARRRRGSSPERKSARAA